MATTQLLGASLYGNGARFGCDASVTPDGLTMAVGAYLWNGTQGIVGIFNRVDGAWVWQYNLTLSGEFGYGVHFSEDGTLLFIGSHYMNTYTGVVTIYKKNASGVYAVFSQLGGPFGLNAGFGISIATSPNDQILAVGAWYYSSYRGAVQLYTRNGNDGFTGLRSLIPASTGGSQSFGYAIGFLDNDRLLISSVSLGKLEVWKDAGNGTWFIEKTITKPSGVGQSFGISLAVSRDRRYAAIGASGSFCIYDTEEDPDFLSPQVVLSEGQVQGPNILGDLEEMVVCDPLYMSDAGRLRMYI